MTAYYNEIDPYAAQWLRNLASKGLISDGHVDERSVIDVRAADLAGYDRCHFFAGIGGWSYALRLAGWPDERGPVWTGSCPCQPFSVAGKGRTSDDERDLWPAFYNLIAECKPATVFGEQIAGADGLEWLARVRLDLERAGYAVGAAHLCAAGVGAPQRRYRLYWVADSTGRWRGQDGPEIQRQAGGRGGKGFWDGAGPVSPDGRSRNIWRVEPGTRPLAPRIPSYLDILRAYGNTIVPALGAEFIRAFLGSAR